MTKERCTLRTGSSGSTGTTIAESTDLETFQRASYPVVWGCVEDNAVLIRTVGRIFQLTRRDLRAIFPPLKTLDRHPINLPTQLTLFIGRKKDLDRIGYLLQRQNVQLVTFLDRAELAKHAWDYKLPA